MIVSTLWAPLASFAGNLKGKGVRYLKGEEALQVKRKKDHLKRDWEKVGASAFVLVLELPAARGGGGGG